MAKRSGLLRALGAALLLILAVLALGGFAQGRAELELMQTAEEKYAALREVRRAALEEYLTGIVEETRYWANDAVLRGALTTFRTAWDDLGEDPQGELRRIFVEEGPRDRKGGLEFARNGSSYADAHASYHDWFRRFLTHRGFYDVFLIDPAGNLIYTAFKEIDYATNLETGPYRDTGLARAFRAARESRDPEFVSLTDFEAYAPSQGAPAAFLASPVVGAEDGLLGVLAFQVASDAINRIMRVETGMGRTGETYVVGSDLRMRSNSRFLEEPTALAMEVDTEPARRALEGETGILVAPDYRGVTVLSAHAPLQVHGLRWAVLAEIDEDEVTVSADGLRRSLAAAGAVIVVVSVAVLSLAAVLMPDRSTRVATL